jgi:hypothetical protein
MLSLSTMWQAFLLIHGNWGFLGVTTDFTNKMIFFNKIPISAIKSNVRSHISGLFWRNCVRMILLEFLGHLF